MRFLLSRRWFLFFGIVVVLAYFAFRLGEWQFDRLTERETRNAVTRENIVAEPAPVEGVLAVGRPVSPGDEWRTITASGEYVATESVVVRYQTRDGQSGVDVVTPLLTDEGVGLLVNRGWLATDNVGTTRPDLPAPPSGRVTVTAWVRADATGSSTEVEDRSTRAVSSEAIGETLPFPVYGGFAELDEEDPAPAERLAKVETPDLGEGPHFFYGLQWWFFGALALFGFGYLVWDERRRMLRTARLERIKAAGALRPPDATGPPHQPRTPPRGRASRE